jgi:hypothetical protein
MATLLEIASTVGVNPSKLDSGASKTMVINLLSWVTAMYCENRR